MAQLVVKLGRQMEGRIRMSARARIATIVFWGVSLVMVGVYAHGAVRSEAQNSRVVQAKRVSTSRPGPRCPRTVLNRCPRTVL